MMISLGVCLVAWVGSECVSHLRRVGLIHVELRYGGVFVSPCVLRHAKLRSCLVASMYEDMLSSISRNMKLQIGPDYYRKDLDQNFKKQSSPHISK